MLPLAIGFDLRRTGGSSARYGNCEVCGGRCDEVYSLTVYRPTSYLISIGNFIGEKPVGGVWGHRTCLLNLMKKRAEEARRCG